MKKSLSRLIVGTCAPALLAGVAWHVVPDTAAFQGEGAKAPSSRRNFVACPIVRDTSTLPCWLAESDGELYYLGSQGSSGSAFYPPQLGHEALVEGTVSAGPRICGGIPLVPVRVSVMTELNRACNTVLPAEAAFTSAPSPLAPIPRYPETTREFTVPYDFDSEYLTLHATRVVDEAARIAKAVMPARVEVFGRRGATLLSNGRVLAEGPGIGERRARTMGEDLVGLGVPAGRVHVTWQGEPDAPDGVNDPERRRLTIALRP
jgi:outer membrane protein OmpA-like peptidoglycan-associated protein